MLYADFLDENDRFRPGTYHDGALVPPISQ